jgi:hypothetical protein
MWYVLHNTACYNGGPEGHLLVDGLMIDSL